MDNTITALRRRRVIGNCPSSVSIAPIASNAQNAHSGWVDWYLNSASSRTVLSKAAAVEMCSRCSSLGRRNTYDMRKIGQYSARIPALAANSGNGRRFPCIGSMIGRSHR